MVLLGSLSMQNQTWIQKQRAEVILSPNEWYQTLTRSDLLRNTAVPRASIRQLQQRHSRAQFRLDMAPFLRLHAFDRYRVLLAPASNLRAKGSRQPEQFPRRQP